MKKHVIKRIGLTVAGIASAVVMAGNAVLVSNAATISPEFIARAAAKGSAAITDAGVKVQVPSTTPSQAQIEAAITKAQAAVSQQQINAVASQILAGMQAASAVTPAVSNKNAVLVAYNNQEGMGHIRTWLNGSEFKYSTDANIGDYVLVKAEVYPKASFDGWYINGNRVSENKEYSFTLKEATTACVAKFRATGDYINKTNNVSQTSWENMTTRFAPGYGHYDTAVTTSFVAQGPEFVNAVNSVIGFGKLVRTYNITLTQRNGTETLDQFYSPQNLVFVIPQELRAPGRIFKMVLVRKGQPMIMDDLDTSDDTLTFSTQYPGAFALVQY